MGKVIFSVSYEIDSEKRGEYLALMREVSDQITKITGQNYTVYEDFDHPNLMSEVFYLESEAEFEKVKDYQKKKTVKLLKQIDQYIVNQDQVAIRTFREAI